MDPTGVQGSEEARRRLLEEGARSYLGAVTALLEYQREVQKKCREVVKKSLRDYSSALKVPLADNEIQDSTWPPFAKWEGDYWSLGVKIIRKDIPKIPWWGFFCGLEYELELGDQGLYCCVGEMFSNRKRRNFVFKKFQQLDPNIEDSGSGVWIMQKLKIEDAATFDLAMKPLIQKWIRLWNKVGGINEVFKRYEE